MGFKIGDRVKFNGRPNSVGVIVGYHEKDEVFFDKEGKNRNPANKGDFIVEFSLIDGNIRENISIKYLKKVG